jgi:predicted NUDIX family NTP pyrophosphohydrolase
MKTSAGIILYRQAAGALQVLLVHPGGPFWKNKDEGAWSIPKGEVGDDEEPLKAALREFQEELGSPPPPGPFTALTPIKQKGGKLVMAWGCVGDLDTTTLVSGTFEMEWPPRSGKRASFPEVDRAEWFELERARLKINAGQLPLIDELARITSPAQSP